MNIFDVTYRKAHDMRNEMMHALVIEEKYA